MSLKKFIFSQADQPVVKPKEEVDHTYKKFRIEIITSVFISYAVFYLTRKNFSAAMPAMLTDTSLTAQDFAIMSSVFYILYGSMKFVAPYLLASVLLTFFSVFQIALLRSMSCIALMLFFRVPVFRRWQKLWPRGSLKMNAGAGGQLLKRRIILAVVLHLS